MQQVWGTSQVCVYMCHQPYGLLVVNYTPNPPHAPTQANQPPYKHTLAFTLSPKQPHYIENTLTGECRKEGKSQQFLGLCSTNHTAAAERYKQLSQSGNGRKITNSSMGQKLKQLEIEINQSDPEDWTHWCVVFEALLRTFFLCSQTCMMLMTLNSIDTFINTPGNPKLQKIDVLQDKLCFLRTLRNWKQRSAADVARWWNHRSRQSKQYVSFFCSGQTDNLKKKKDVTVLHNCLSTHAPLFVCAHPFFVSVSVSACLSRSPQTLRLHGQ